MENSDVYKKIKNNWDLVAKPLDSLGKFEPMIARIGAIKNQEYPDLRKNVIIVFGSDNGIVEEGISQSGQEVTAYCMENFSKRSTSVCVMANANAIDILPVDVGINADLSGMTHIIHRKIRKGTRNFLKEPAMTEKEALQGIEIGRNLVLEYKEKGYGVMGVGEIGIGNTTTTSAVATALLGCSAKEVTGRGAGLSDEGLIRKIAVIEEAINTYQLYEKTPMEVLCHVGGYDLAGMVGVYLGGKEYGMPIVLDGVISVVAALLAERMEAGVKEYLIPSHISREPAAIKMFEELHLDPVIHADMALGEGTGAVLMISMIKTVYEVYRNGCPFAKMPMEQYERF